MKAIGRYCIFILILILVLVGFSFFLEWKTSEKNTIFDMQTIKKINIGDTKEQVESILGTPDCVNENATIYRYFDGKDENDEPKSYRYIEVVFGENTLKELLFDTTYQATDSKSKKRIAYRLINSPTLCIGETSCMVHYAANFSDGSYYIAETLANSTSEENIDNLPKSKIRWEDRWQKEYNAIIPIVNANGMIFGTGCYIKNNTLGIYSDSFVIDKELSNIELKNINTVYIHKNVNKMNFEAVCGDSDLWKNLSSVEYEGNIFQWCKIEFNSTPLKYAGNLYCDGEIVKDVILDGVGRIGRNAFSDCTSIETLTLNNIDRIEDKAFYNCRNLRRLEIFDEQINLGVDVFDKCTNISKVKVCNEYIEYLDIDNIFELTIFGKGTIKDKLFENNKNLVSVNIEGDICEIGNRVFYNCENLKKIKLSDEILVINSEAFAYCENLQEVVLPEKLKTIGKKAFASCNKLLTITIPQGLEKIDGEAFYNNKKLIEIQNLSSIEINIDNTNVMNVYSDEKDSKLIEKDGFVYYFENNDYMLIGYFGDKVEIEVPENINGQVFKFYKYAFYSANNLKKITLPNNITEITNEMFSGCNNLEEIYLSESIKKIGYAAFKDCVSLKTIKIPQNIDIINAYTFDNCKNLNDIRLPKTLKYIANAAFNNCEMLIEVYFEGNKYDWDNMTIIKEEFGGNNKAIMNAKVNYNFKY